MTESDIIELHTQRIHHVADMIAEYFPEQKPSVDEFNALPDEVFDLVIDQERLDEGWVLYQHRPPQKRGGGSFDHTGEPEPEISINDQLVAHMHAAGYDPDGKLPSVKSLKSQGFDCNAAQRDLAWSQYTLEIQVDNNTTDEDLD